VLKRPDADPTNRRFERFLVCASLVGLIIFSVAGHQKSRLIIPLFPFVALLAGREVARLVTRWSDRTVLRLAALVVVVVAIGIFVRAHFLLRRNSRVDETLAARQVARLIPERLGANAPLTYVDSPFALQFYLNYLRPPVSFERAASLLRGSAAAWVAVHEFAGLQKELGPDTNSLHEVLRWPLAGEPLIRIVGNRPLPVTNQPVAMLLGPLRLEAQTFHLEHPRINYRRGIEMDVLGGAAQGRLRIENQGPSPQMVRLRMFDPASAVAPTQVQSNLPPGAVWSLPEPAVRPAPPG
jgi:4-amino-4-deoxy-L-arabinose transferase-like glycosyltransferase